jgi:hypothetical protein
LGVEIVRCPTALGQGLAVPPLPSVAAVVRVIGIPLVGGGVS